MNCAWQAYLNLLPAWMREDVDRHGKHNLQELRIRIDRYPELITGSGTCYLQKKATLEDLTYCINMASKYSPWSSATISSGYITAAGGHRVGVCGEVSMVNGRISTISNVTSICIRVARDFPDIGLDAGLIKGSILIIGAPGQGKTTLLRDIIRQKSKSETVAVVDERRELFPTVAGEFCFPPGKSTDVLSGCRKSAGMQMLLRTMNPRWIAVDEITEAEDSQGIIQAAWCGVELLATAHAMSLNDYQSRPVYRPLITNGIFQNVIVMRPDKSWYLERVNI